MKVRAMSVSWQASHATASTFKSKPFLGKQRRRTVSGILALENLHNGDLNWGYYSCPSLRASQTAYLRELLISAQRSELVSTHPDLKTLQ